jgi:hypothetical protein
MKPGMVIASGRNVVGNRATITKGSPILGKAMAGH